MADNKPIDGKKAAYISGGKFKISSDHEQAASTNTEKHFAIRLKTADVVILYPSFLCPLLKRPDDPICIIVLTDRLFFKTYKKQSNKTDSANTETNPDFQPALCGAVNRFLKISPWGKDGPESHKLLPSDEPLFSTNELAKQNIEVNYLWDLDKLTDGLLSDGEKQLFAQIHPTVQAMYQKSGLIYGFEIRVKNYAGTSKIGLYNIAWIAYDRKEENNGTGAAPIIPIARSNNKSDLNSFRNENPHFYEPQDRILNQYNNETYRKDYHPLSCDVTHDDAPVFSDVPTELHSYHPIYVSEKDCLNIGQLSDVHISSRQELFKKSNARLIDGVEGTQAEMLSPRIGSLVNSSYTTLKELMNQFGSDKDIDLLFLTGDLIDYSRNFNPNNRINGIDKIKNSADIWNALNLDNLTDKALYPVGIDILVAYELFRWYSRTYQKPLLLIAGNHEAYAVPYGISSRIKLMRGAVSNYFSKKWDVEFNKFGVPTVEIRKMTVDEVIEQSKQDALNDKREAEEQLKAGGSPDIYSQRVNHGIPADHNLTLQEAILMYGPDFARVVMGASVDRGGLKNFKNENYEWFFKVFTPLSSFILRYHAQCFTALGWGEDESINSNFLKQGEWSLGGFLPRANTSVTDAQIQLLSAAVEWKQPKKSDICSIETPEKVIQILVTHFTFVSYNTTEAIGDTGEVNYNDTASSFSLYDYGTFENNRNIVYKWIAEGVFSYTLSGHSHRSGLYEIVDGDASRIRANMTVRGHVARNDKFDPRPTGCRILVAGSGGPIAVRNTCNEFFNQGLDFPSGNFIKFDGRSEKEIGIKRSGVPQAKPRLAVALDYADLFLSKGLILQFASDQDNGAFTIVLDPQINLPAADTKNLFRRIHFSFYSVHAEELITLVGAVTLSGTTTQGQQIFSILLGGRARRVLEDLALYEKMAFIRIELGQLHSSEFANTYNSTSDWIFPIEIHRQAQLAVDEYEKEIATSRVGLLYDPNLAKRLEDTIEGYVVNRHRQFGEIPNLKWYNWHFQHEY